MIEFTKEQLIARADHLLCVGKAFIADHPEYDGMAKDVELFKIALASLKAEPDFKKLAVELVENLVDCSGADDSAVKQYLKWTEKTCRAAISYPKREA